MTVIADINALGEKYENLPDILARFEEELERVKEILDIKGKPLNDVLRTNAANMHYYDELRKRMRKLVKYFKMEEERVRATLYRSYTENYTRSLSPQQVAKYLDNEEEYIKIHSLLIEVEEVYDLYDTAVEALKSNNFLLRDITKLRVADLEFVEI